MKLYNINKLPGFRISSTGILVDSNDLIQELHVFGNLAIFRIGSRLVDGAQLMWNFFIGENSYSIGRKDDDISNISIKNLIVKIHCHQITEDTFLINGLLFTKIPKFPNYVISRDGTVFSLRRKAFVIRSFNHAGYPTVSIIDENGNRSPRKVHRLVYSTYCGELIEGLVIDHLDANVQNPSAMNLQQISQYENSFRSYTIENTHRIWNIHQIETVCELISKGKSNDEILTSLNLEKNDENFRKIIMLTHLLRNRKIYRNIADKYKISKIPSAINRKDRIFEDDDIIVIRERYNNGSKISDLAKEYSCTSKTISDIIHHKKWKFLQ